MVKPQNPSMNQGKFIYIEGSEKRKITTVVKRFCLKEGGKGIQLTISLHALEGGNYVLFFHQVPPFDLFCELLFTLHTQLDGNKKVRAYCKNNSQRTELPDKTMIFINAGQNLSAIDSEGNLYEEDSEAGPYSFRKTAKQMDYISILKEECSSLNKSATFHIAKKRTGTWERLSAKMQGFIYGSKQSVSGCLPLVILLGLWAYSFSLSARTEHTPLPWYLAGIALTAGILPFNIIKAPTRLFFGKNGYIFKVLAIFLILEILVYIPNYHLSRHIGEEKAVVEELYNHGKRNNHRGALLRLTNNDTFDLEYGIRDMQPGDTCFIDLWKGIWGLRICRGLKSGDEQIWKY